VTKLKQLGLHVILLAGVIAVFEVTNIDITVQDNFYLQDMHRWTVDRHEPMLRFIFYTGPKTLLIIMGIFCIAIFLYSLKDQRYRRYRRGSLLLILSLILVPLSIAGLKRISGVCTPNETTRYGGKTPYVKVLEKNPPDFIPQKHGQGWPAGHAAGGFSLMMLYFVFREKVNRILGLLMGIATGWAMGLYQTVNGQHYLSHTIIAMQIGWIVILVIHEVVQNVEARNIFQPNLNFLMDRPIIKKSHESI
jgi:membrane-associated PAP2 superfamily phosphatase